MASAISLSENGFQTKALMPMATACSSDNPSL